MIYMIVQVTTMDTKQIQPMQFTARTTPDYFINVKNRYCQYSWKYFR